MEQAMERLVKFTDEHYYHVYNKSIEKFEIFRSSHDYQRMIMLMKFYQHKDRDPKFSYFLRTVKTQHETFDEKLSKETSGNVLCVEIIAYCIMPTHIHFILKQESSNGIQKFMANILNSYAKFFNTKYARKGPLWVGRFKGDHIDSTEDLLQLTRYVHLNPTTSYLVDKPEDWPYSSYNDYLGNQRKLKPICAFPENLDIDIESYKQFVNDRIDFQRELSKLKKINGLYA